VPHAARPDHQFSLDILLHLVQTVIGDVMAQPGRDISDKIDRRWRDVGKFQCPAFPALINQREQPDPMPALHQLQRHLISYGRSQRMPADKVRADRLMLQYGIHVEPGRSLDRAENVLGNAQIGRLDTEERSLVSHVPCK
jgi:hypothetical protein